MSDVQTIKEEHLITERVEAIDQLFRNLNIHDKDIAGGEAKKQLKKPIHNFNSRGEIVLSPKQIRERYQDAWPLIKWYQMPFCRRSIYKKLCFWTPASFILAWTYGEYVKKKDKGKEIQLPLKFYGRAFAVIFAVTTAYCFAQSLLFDQFCDIDSAYYQETESRLNLAKKLRGNKPITKVKSTIRAQVGYSLFFHEMINMSELEKSTRKAGKSKLYKPMLYFTQFI